MNNPLGVRRGVEQGGKSPFSLLSEPISPTSLLFEPISPSSLNASFSFSPSSLLFPPISPSSQLYLGHFFLLPILFLPPPLALVREIRELHEVKKKYFGLDGNRTHDLRIRSTVTLPTELQGRTEKVGDDLGGESLRRERKGTYECCAAKHYEHKWLNRELTLKYSVNLSANLTHE